jgi:hypothetical protein
MSTLPDPVPAGNLGEPDPAEIKRPPPTPMTWRCLKCGWAKSWLPDNEDAVSAAYRAIDAHQGSCRAMDQYFRG